MKKTLIFIMAGILAFSALVAETPAAETPAAETPAAETATAASKTVSFPEGGNNYPIIFIHGISAGFDKWAKVANELGGENYFEMRYNANGSISDNFQGSSQKRQVWNISYYTSEVVTESLVGNLTVYSERVSNMVDRIKIFSGEEKVILIAHSMGGLIARKYMLSEKGSCVYKLITVATPNEGVWISPGIIGQFEDLRRGSKYVEAINRNWTDKISKERFGTIGCVDTGLDGEKIRGNMTDSGGPAFVEISSAIPFGEWKKGTRNIGKIIYDSDKIGFIAVVRDTHEGIRTNAIIYEAIKWALE